MSQPRWYDTIAAFGLLIISPIVLILPMYWTLLLTHNTLFVALLWGLIIYVFVKVWCLEVLKPVIDKTQHK